VLEAIHEGFVYATSCICIYSQSVDPTQMARLVVGISRPRSCFRARSKTGPYQIRRQSVSPRGIDKMVLCSACRQRYRHVEV
jgi:hypothetical protein